jgi:hypothetical protein
VVALRAVSTVPSGSETGVAVSATELLRPARVSVCLFSSGADQSLVSSGRA